VEALFFFNQHVPSLPKGIAQILPNLKALTVESSQLNAISKEDLSPFPNLMYLRLNGNQLEALAGDLFVENSNIVYIDFNRNKIETVGTGLLQPLISLTHAFFNDNTCIDSNAGSPSSFEALKQDLETKCPETLIINAEDSITAETFKIIIIIIFVVIIIIIIGFIIAYLSEHRKSRK